MPDEDGDGSIEVTLRSSIPACAKPIEWYTVAGSQHPTLQQIQMVADRHFPNVPTDQLQLYVIKGEIYLGRKEEK